MFQQSYVTTINWLGLIIQIESLNGLSPSLSVYGCVCMRAWVHAGGVRFSSSNRIIPSDYRILLLLKMPIPNMRGFLPFFSTDPLKLCQVGWGLSIDRNFQVSPEMFNWVQVQALAGPLKDVHGVLPKLLLYYLGSLLKVIVLLECDPLAQCEVLRALDPVFIKDIAVFLLRSAFLLKNTPTSRMLPPPCSTSGMVLCRYWAVPGFLQT